MKRHKTNWGKANSIHVANDKGQFGKASNSSSIMMRLGPVPMVVPVPPQLADMETHIANMARLDLELKHNVKIC